MNCTSEFIERKNKRECKTMKSRNKNKISIWDLGSFIISPAEKRLFYTVSEKKLLEKDASARISL